MLDFQRIVFPTDFSECSDQAFDYAVFMAERFDSELHMLHAQVLHFEDPANPTHQFPETQALLDRLEKVAHSELGEVASRDDVSVLRIRQAQRRGFDIGSVILDFAPPELVPFLAIGAFAGLRPAEIERLDWRNIDFLNSES